MTRDSSGTLVSAPVPATPVPLADQIANSVKTGQPLTANFDDLFAGAAGQGFAVSSLSIDFTQTPLTGGAPNPLAGGGLYKIAALVPALPIAQWLPSDGHLSSLFDQKSITLDRVDFTLAKQGNPQGNQVLSITIAVGVCEPDGWTPSFFEGTALDHIKPAFTGLEVSVGNPFGSDRAITAEIFGTLTIGAAPSGGEPQPADQPLVLDITLSCPDIVLEARQPSGQPAAMKTVLKAFDITLPQSLQDIQISDVDLVLDVPGKAMSFSGSVIDEADLRIITDLLYLREITVNLSTDPAATQVGLMAGLVIGKPGQPAATNNQLLLGAGVNYTKRHSAGGDSSSWVMSAGLDVPGTAQLMGIAATGGRFEIPVQRVIASLGGESNDDINDLMGGSSVSLLGIGGSVTLADSPSCTVYVDIEGQSTLAGKPVEAELSIQYDSASSDLTLIGTVTIDGFEIDLTVQITSGKPQFVLTVPALAGLTGTYETSSGIATLIFSRSITLGALLSQFIAAFTGDPVINLPPPWDFLNSIELPLDDIKFTIDFNHKSFSIEFDFKQKPGIFGNEIDGFKLTYESTPLAGQSKFQFQLLGTFPALGSAPPAWDPTDPSSAPGLPGQGRSKFDIALLAGGQHLLIDPAPKTIPELITQTGAALTGMGKQPGSLPAKMKTSSGAGWLIAGHLIIEEQINVQFGFLDPELYGASIVVSPPKDPNRQGPAFVQALVGLDCQILYRQVTQTIGVYQGTLTLPDSIRTINLGAVSLQLPSIAASIFTNGDFLIDVGFPHGGDFSRSAVIQAAEYMGGGGVLYGQLSGPTATNLPHYDVKAGAFNPVIEFGLGIEFGIGDSFSAGPLSGSIYVKLTAIFDGTFAKYTLFNPPSGGPANDEFYDVLATVSLVGELQAKLDLEIITAELLVRIVISVGIHAIAHKAIQVPMSASVDVSLRVTINLGLFKIHISIGFHAQISYTAVIGQDSTAIWDLPLPPKPAIPPNPAAMLFAVPGPVGLLPPNLMFIALPVTKTAVPLYVIPQLTLGAAGGTPAWQYVSQFGLSAPSPADPSNPAHAQPIGITEVTELTLAWFMRAMKGAGSGPSAPGQSPADYYAGVTVTKDDLKVLQQAIQQTGPSLRGSAPATPTLAEMQAFLSSCLSFTVALPPAAATTTAMSMGFFPALPGIALQAATESQALGDPATAPDQVEAVLRDYLKLLALTGAQIAESHFESAAKGADSITLADLYTALQAAGDFASIPGMTTRFMLHGTRIGAAQTPLYQLTGQEVTLPDLTGATTLKLTVSSTEAANWGLTFPGNDPVTGNPAIILSSGDPAPIIHSPTEIATYVKSVSEAGLSAGGMNAFETTLRPFGIKPAILPSGQGSVQTLPTALTSYLKGQDQASQPLFGIYPATNLPQPLQEMKLVPAGQYSWATTVDFTVAPLLKDTQTSNPGLASTYELQAVDADGLARLEAAYRAFNPQPGDKSAPPPFSIAAMELAFELDDGKGGKSITILPATPPGVFIYNANLSTETQPPQAKAAFMALAAAPLHDQVIDFVGRLLSGGLTNSGGYYLHLDPANPLPKDLFAGTDRARLTLVISYTTANDLCQLSSFISALRLGNPLASLKQEVFAGSPGLTSAYSTLAPGQTGFLIQRPAISAVDSGNHQSSIDNLFNLIAVTPTAFSADAAGAGASPISGFSVTLSPYDAGQGGGALFAGQAIAAGAAPQDPPLIYKQVFDLVALNGGGKPGVPLDPANNPYARNGQYISYAAQWIDMYGNSLPMVFKPAPVRIGITDPCLTLLDWPGLTFGYHVDAAKNQVMLSLVWKPSADGTAASVAALLDRFALLYFQLDSVTLSLQTSLFKDAATPQDVKAGGNTLNGAQQLQANIEQIVTAIEAGAQKTLVLAPLTFALPTLPADFNDTVLFELHAVLQFDRSGFVDPAFAGDAAVTAAQTVLPPFVSNGSAPLAPGQPETVLAFAQGIETACASLGFVVLAGMTGNNQTPPFWIMKFGPNGVLLAMDGDSDSLSPPPYSTMLIDRSGIDPTIRKELHADNQFIKQIGPSLSVAGYDIDSHLSQAFEKIDQFFGASYGVIAAKLYPDLIAACAGYKVEIAAALAQRAKSMSIGKVLEPAVLAAGQERYHQDCLNQLGNYYAVDAVNVYKLNYTVNAGANAADLLARLSVYGRLRSEDVPQSIALSSSKTTLTAPSSPLAISIKPQKIALQKKINLPTSFEIQAFELIDGSIVVNSGPGNADPVSLTTGTWLHFVDPAHGTLSAKAASVPLPLRVYPATPSLASQGFAVNGSFVPAAEALDKAKDWSLQCEYQHAFIAQDTVNVLATFNESLQPASTFAALADEDIVSTLAQFDAIWPGLETELAQGLIGDDPQVSAVLTEAIAAVQALLKLFARTVGAPVLSPPHSDGSLPQLAGKTCRFDLFEGPDTSGNWTVSVIDLPDPSPVAAAGGTWACPQPIMGIATTPSDEYLAANPTQHDGRSVYTFTMNQTPLTAVAAQAVTTRTLSIDGLNVLSLQSGRYSLRISRNEHMELPDDFIYRTAWTSAKTPVHPFVDRTVAIDITPYHTGSTPDLQSCIAGFLIKLLSLSLDLGVQVAGSLQIKTSLAYPGSVLSGGGDNRLSDIMIPLALNLPETVTFGEGEAAVDPLVAQLVATINGWLSANDISATNRPELWSVAKLQFDTTIFSNLSQSGVPILRLGGCYLPLKALPD